MNAEIFQASVEVYLAQLAVRGPMHPIFEKMHAEASRRNFPIVGPEVGRIFYQIAAMRKPARVLELGSGFGYSAMWWALGCNSTHVFLTDRDEENLQRAKEYAQEAGCAARFHCHMGDALTIARGLGGTFDILFADIDKVSYPLIVDLAEEILAPGALLVFDNMVWHGKVARPEAEWEKDTRAVVETTRRLYDSKHWATSLIPARDGVLVAIRNP